MRDTPDGCAVVGECFISFEAIGDAEQRQWMGFARAVFSTCLHDALLDPPAGDRAIRADVVGFELRHPAKHRLADLHRIAEELALHAPCAVMARAPLDGVDRRSGNGFERLARLLADLLHARMTRNVVAHLAERSL